MIATCEVCPKEGDTEPFRVPWDEHGAEIMKAHFAEKHPEVQLEQDK